MGPIQSIFIIYQTFSMYYNTNYFFLVALARYELITENKNNEDLLIVR